MKTTITIAVFLLAAVMLTGCSQQTVGNATQDLNHDVAVANQKADQVASNVKPDLQAVDYGARVTVALRANQNLPTSIHVDANAHGVRLSGTVSTHHEKALAGQIARQTLASNLAVQNDLKIE